MGERLKTGYGEMGTSENRFCFITDTTIYLFELLEPMKHPAEQKGRE